MRFIENTKSAIVLYVLFHCTRRECNGTCSIALLENGIFYSISRDHKQPIKRSEFNKVLYKTKSKLVLSECNDLYFIAIAFIAFTLYMKLNSVHHKTKIAPKTTFTLEQKFPDL